MPAWPGHVARHQPARGLEIQHGDLRLQQRGLHPLAFAGDLALQQGDERAHGGVVAAGEIGNRHADAHRALAGQTGDRHQAAHALGDLVEARTVGIGAVLAEAGQAHVDEPRIDRAQRLVVDAEPLLHVGPVVLDQHVGGGRQLLQDRDALGRLEVERDAALVAVQVEEIGAVARPAQSGLSSAPAGISTLITSAPQSAKWRAAVGPARARVRSITLKRARGPLRSKFIQPLNIRLRVPPAQKTTHAICRPRIVSLRWVRWENGIPARACGRPLPAVPQEYVTHDITSSGAGSCAREGAY